MERQDPRTAALEIVNRRFGDAAVAFLSGSVMRGEATETSDLDLVVVYERLGNAYRESFLHGGWPVEAFVHDPETLRYFFWEVDRAAGVPSLPDMVLSGAALPQANELSRSLQALAEEVIAKGPPVWSEADIDASRYKITNLIDDLRAPRSRNELFAIATELYSTVAEHFLRAQGLWSAKSKAIPRRLIRVSPEFAGRFNAAFLDVFENGRSRSVIDLCQELLTPYGGWLFSGYKVVAPLKWRLSSTPPAHTDALERTREA